MSAQLPELQRLTELARQADLPSAERLARVRARLNVPPPAAGGGGGGGSAPGSKALASKLVGQLGATKALWISAAALGAVSLALVGQPQLKVAPEAPVSIAPLENHPQPAGQAPEPPAATLPELQVPPDSRVTSAQAPPRVQPSHGTRRTATAPVRKPAPLANSFAEEVALLQVAIDAMHAGELAEAKSALGQHAQRFPTSQLAPERTRLLEQLQSTSR